MLNIYINECEDSGLGLVWLHNIYLALCLQVDISSDLLLSVAISLLYKPKQTDAIYVPLKNCTLYIIINVNL